MLERRVPIAAEYGVFGAGVERFDELTTMLDRSPAATRQLASRARRRVRDGAPTPDADQGRQREVVDAFFAAARLGDFDALVAVLAPDVVLRADGGRSTSPPSVVLNDAHEVARNAGVGCTLAEFVRPALLNGAAGAVVVMPTGKRISVMAFTVTDGRIVAIDVLYDPEYLAGLDLTAVGL
ncbi:MAG TPA: hypothetical protein VFN21_09855 [Acidimicrobiales bacterium]|nr:hypothetical protein [Acidimicrobiales bacterium]